jgi:hypothetical protein
VSTADSSREGGAETGASPASDAVGELYALAPEDFIGARDALARRLRAEGDRAGAERVKALRRPSPALWAVNALARAEPGAIAALLQAAEGLRSAQGRLLAGEPGADLHRSLIAHRDAVNELADAGRRLLEEEGRPATPLMTERIRRTLHSASLLEEARPLLAGGRLTGEVPAQGFGLDGAIERQADAAPRRRRGDGGLDAERRERERRAAEREFAQQALETAERVRDDALDALRKARAEVERLEAAEASAARALETAERATVKAERALSRARDAERRAREEVADAAERTGTARSGEELAQASLDRAQDEVEAARTTLRATREP